MLEASSRFSSVTDHAPSRIEESVVVLHGRPVIMLGFNNTEVVLLLISGQSERCSPNGHRANGTGKGSLPLPLWRALADAEGSASAISCYSDSVLDHLPKDPSCRRPLAFQGCRLDHYSPGDTA